MRKESLVICHNAVGSIPAKNSEQARALQQCLAELEAEMQAQEPPNNVIVMERQQAASPTEVHRRQPGKKREQPLRQNPPPPEGSTAEN